jgi:hypothetical protein
VYRPSQDAAARPCLSPSSVQPTLTLLRISALPLHPHCILGCRFRCQPSPASLWAVNRGKKHAFFSRSPPSGLPTTPAAHLNTQQHAMLARLAGLASAALGGAANTPVATATAAAGAMVTLRHIHAGRLVGQAAVWEEVSKEDGLSRAAGAWGSVPRVRRRWSRVVAVLRHTLLQTSGWRRTPTATDASGGALRTAEAAPAERLSCRLQAPTHHAHTAASHTHLCDNRSCAWRSPTRRSCGRLWMC